MEQIITVGKSAELIIPGELLKKLGVNAGDELELKIIDRTLTVRPLSEAERANKIDSLTSDLFEERREAYLELAKGHE